MKVSELIEKLQALPQDREVVNGEYMDITRVMNMLRTVDDVTYEEEEVVMLA